jgi:hypothetical protein
MTRAALALALCLAITPALGQQRSLVCPPTDYAQLRDRAATPDGRKRIAASYCAWKVAFEARDAFPPRDRAACADEMSKALDVLEASGDQAQIGRAKAGCPDLIPPR